VVAVRRRNPAVVDESAPPGRLFSNAVADWVGVDEVAPEGWDDWAWRRVTAYRRRWEARAVWARQHGMTVHEAFRALDAGRGRR
jgi:hypothetical protein